MFLHVAKMVFFDLLGGLFLITSLVFLFYMVMTLLLLGKSVLDASLCLTDRFWLTFIMVVGLLWGSWMVYFSYTLGLSCLTN